MKLFLSVIGILLFSISCENKKQSDGETASTETEQMPVTLALKWETDPVLTTCESVIYDEDRDVLYVANINGGPAEKDGNGSISKVSLEGKVVEQQWVTGMDAPKGMGINDGNLYVSDINRVHQIDIESGRITRTYPVETAKFLNDITVSNGKVYISGSRGGAIYVIDEDKVSAWMEKLQNPNGLYGEDGKLVMALWDAKNLNTVDVSSKKVTQRTEGIETPDGIEAIGNNEYLVSSWNGLIHHIDSDWKKTLILDTRKDSVNAADIEYIKSKNLLLVPTFFKNTVVAYEVKK